MALRLYAFVHSDGKLEPVALDRLEAFYRTQRPGRLPEYAGRRIGIALVFVERDRRGPRRILRVETWVDAVREDGRRAEAFLAALARCTQAKQPECQRRGNLIDARARFRRKRLQDQYDWRPAPPQMRQIQDSIFG